MESKSHIENDDFDKKNFLEKKFFLMKKKNFFFPKCRYWWLWISVKENFFNMWSSLVSFLDLIEGGKSDSPCRGYLGDEKFL